MAMRANAALVHPHPVQRPTHETFSDVRARHHRERRRRRRQTATRQEALRQEGQAGRGAEPPPPPPPPELWPERVLNLVYAGHRPNRGDFYPDADEPAARLSLLRISELPAWMREIIETEYDEVVDDEELPSDDEGSGRSFGHDFNDAGGLDIEWTDPDDAASWFYITCPAAIARACSTLSHRRTSR